jgi:hypothetical protein
VCVCVHMRVYVYVYMCDSILRFEGQLSSGKDK